jgi:hypothetical protein
MTDPTKIDYSQPIYTYEEDYVHADGRVQRITVKRYNAVPANTVQWSSPRNRRLLTQASDTEVFVAPPTDDEPIRNDADYTTKVYTAPPIDGRREWTESEVSAEEQALTIRTEEEME